MVKKKSTNKNKSKISLLKLKTSTFNYSLFKSKIDYKTLLIYIAINLLVVSIINTIRSKTSVSMLPPIQTFFSSFFGMILIGLFIFTLFYVFLSAFEGKIEGFWYSFVIFLTITMPFLVAGHILNWIRETFIGSSSFITSLLIIIMVYFIFNLIFQMKVHFKTTSLRVLASFMLVDIILGVFAVLEYMSYLLLNLK